MRRSIARFFSPGRAPAAPPPAAASRPPSHDYAAESVTLAHFYNFTRDDIAASIAACQAAAARPPVNRVAWFIPHFTSAHAGGVNTILRIANHLFAVEGIAQVFCVTGAPDAATPRASVAAVYPALAAAEFVGLERIDAVPDLGPLDAAFATLWMTALSVLKLRNVARKFCFLQDWEPEFYPAGSTGFLVEASYRFGFHAICIGPVIAAGYRELGGTAEHVSYAAEPAIFHARRPARAPDAPWRLFCYGRPTVPRSGFELAAAALHDIKASLGDRIDIVLSGDDWDAGAYGLGGVARNLGMVPHDAMGDVYRSADVAICLTASRVPSLLMLELLACGTPLVTIRNRHHAWLFGDSDAVFECEASRADIASAVRTVLHQPALRAARVARGVALVAEQFSDWRPAYAQVAAAIRRPPP